MSGSGSKRALLIAVLSALLLHAPHGHADISSEQVRLAASGRFDLLAERIEAHGRTTELKTRDLHALCYAYSRTKRYTPLLNCLDRLEKRIANGDQRTILFGLSDATPALHIMRAEAMLELGRYTVAVTYADRAIAWLKQDDSDALDLFSDAFAALGIAHALNGDVTRSKQLERTLANMRPGFASDHATAHALALARLRMALQDYSGVLTAIQQDKYFSVNVLLDKMISGAFITGANNWAWIELPRAFMLNKALLETGQIEQARQGFDKLLGISQIQANGEIHWLLLSGRARIAESDQQIDQAINYLRAAIDIIETQRASINTETSKIGFVGNKQAIYGNLIRLAKISNQPRLALEYIDRSKSRALVDLLAGRRELTLTAARDEGSRHRLVRYLDLQDKQAEQQPLSGNQSAAGSRAAIKDATDTLRKHHAELSSLVTVNPTSSDELLALIRPGEAMLEFLWHEKALYGLAADGQKTLLLEIPSIMLEDKIRNFRSAIDAETPNTIELAQELYRDLIAPFSSVIGHRDLLVIPHGPLHYLPFSALSDGQHPLIENHTLRQLPSASIQKFMKSRPRPAQQSALILGNPDLGVAKDDLPSAEEEARAISNTLPSSRILLRSQATETAFKKTARNYPILHIASHGEFNAEAALNSRLRLSPDQENDGSLTVNELYQLELNADLVTLSACETGLGTILNGDDLVGLNRGFLYAGSRNVIASLWKVDDEATTLLMQHFYKLLQGGASVKTALRNAQRQLRKTHPAPFYWSAFYLTGNGE